MMEDIIACLDPEIKPISAAALANGLTSEADLDAFYEHLVEWYDRERPYSDEWIKRMFVWHDFCDLPQLPVGSVCVLSDRISEDTDRLVHLGDGVFRDGVIEDFREPYEDEDDGLPPRVYKDGRVYWAIGPTPEEFDPEDAPLRVRHLLNLGKTQGHVTRGQLGAVCRKLGLDVGGPEDDLPYEELFDYHHVDIWEDERGPKDPPAESGTSLGLSGYLGFLYTRGYLGVVTDYLLDVFPASVASHIRTVSHAVDCPVEAAVAPVLAVYARAVVAGWTVNLTRTGTQRAIMYLATAAPAGAGKGPAATYPLAPLHAEDAELYGVWKGMKKGERPDFPPQLVLGDVTAEAVPLAMQANEEQAAGGVLYYPDELTSLVAGMNQYKNGGRGNDKGFYLSAWDAKPWKKMRSGGTCVSIGRPSLVVLGNIPPDQLPRLLPRDGQGDGFIQRWLYHYSDRKWEPRGVQGFDDGLLLDDDPCLQAHHASVRRLHGFSGTRELSLTPHAKEAWVAGVEYWNERRKSRGPVWDKYPGEMETFWSKYRVYAARLVIVLHAMRVASDESLTPETPVDMRTVLNAWRLVDHYLDTAAKILYQLRTTPAQRARDEKAWVATSDAGRQPSGVGQMAEVIMEKVRQRGWKDFKRSELHQVVRDRKGFREASSLTGPLDHLCSLGVLKREMVSLHGGRPAETYHVLHPDPQKTP
jgi:hypothetical protein